MIEITNKLKELLKIGLEYLSQSSELEMNTRRSPEKWSKKEILGHLIDSGINNLQRFTEIQFEERPYILRTYNQDELVKANSYQTSETSEIMGKGDRKTKKGKIQMGTFGVRRPKKKSVPVTAAESKKTTKKAAAPKAKKPAAKKKAAKKKATKKK